MLFFNLFVYSEVKNGELKVTFLFQVSAGAGLPGDAYRSGADHRRLHRRDVRRKRGDRTRQCSGGGPQETLQETQRVRKFFSQQVTKTHALVVLLKRQADKNAD